jgi:hypothetical protein
MNGLFWMAVLAGSLSSSPRFEGVPASGLYLAQGSLDQGSPPSLSSLLGKNWSALQSWEGWGVTPWLRLRVASSGGVRAGGALEASLIQLHTFIRPELTFEQGSRGPAAKLGLQFRL